LRMNSKFLVILTLVAVIGFATVAPVSARGWVNYDVAASQPCACSTLAVYTIYVDTQNAAGPIVAGSLKIPAGYSINAAYLTTTPGIVVATGNTGDVTPYSSNPLTIKTTAIVGQFDVFVGANLVGTGTIILPTATTPGDFGGLFVGMPDNTWSEVSFVAGFFISPCVAGTYIWGPNSATIDIGGVPTEIPVDPRIEHTQQVTIADCAVGGVVVPTNTLAILSPYLAIAGLVIAVSAVVVVKRRRD
jgi:hypothetical protein